MNPLVAALAGGALIGLAASALLLLNGRVAGVTGIVAGLWGPDASWRILFLGGLLLGSAAMTRLVPGSLEVSVHLPAAALIGGGLLVGFGTRLANGCTSGHGVCGIARLSKRSITATAIFMASAALTVYFIRHVLP